MYIDGIEQLYVSPGEGGQGSGEVAHSSLVLQTLLCCTKCSIYNATCFISLRETFRSFPPLTRNHAGCTASSPLLTSCERVAGTPRAISARQAHCLRRCHVRASGASHVIASTAQIPRGRPPLQISQFGMPRRCKIRRPSVSSSLPTRSYCQQRRAQQWNRQSARILMASRATGAAACWHWRCRRQVWLSFLLGRCVSQGVAYRLYANM